MTEAQSMSLLFLSIFWIPSIIAIILKFWYKRTATVVIGRIVEMEPVFRAVRYTFEIDYKGEIEKVKLTPQNAFQVYKMNEEVELYRGRTYDGIVYKFVEKFYSIPIVAMSISGFFFMIMYTSP